MTNDIGTFKAAMPVAQTQATAPARRPETEVQSKQDPKRVDEAEERRQDEQPLNEVVSEMNDLVREMHRELHFSVDEESGDTVIKVINRETDEIVRQIPSEELMHLRKRLQEAAGVIFEDSA